MSDVAGIGGSSFGAPWATVLKALSAFSAGVIFLVTAMFGTTFPRRPARRQFPDRRASCSIAVLIGCALYTVRGYRRPTATAWRSGASCGRRRCRSRGSSAPGTTHTSWTARCACSATAAPSRSPASSATAPSAPTAPGRPIPKRAVALVLPGRKLVVTPDRPQDFLRQLQLLHPQAQVEEAGAGGSQRRPRPAGGERGGNPRLTESGS